MSSAQPVPETSSVDGDELDADDAITALAALRREGVWRLTLNSVQRFRYADGFSHARALAFQMCLAVLPLGVALVGLSRSLGGAGLGEVLVRTLHDLTPGASRAVIDETVRAGQQRAGTGGQLALWLGLLAALVSLATAMGQIERGANRIYGVERDRPTRAKYTRATILGLTAGLAALLGLLILLAGGSMADAFVQVYHGNDTLRIIGDVGRWPVGALLALASFTVLFARSPNRKQPGQSWLAGGALVALALWLVFTGALALYVGHASTFGSTYGPLTGVIALLIWANLTSIALFLGLSFAAQLEAIRPGRGADARP